MAGAVCFSDDVGRMLHFTRLPQATRGIVMPRQTYQGLYDPQFDHDACGVGVVADFNGRKSHEIIRNAIRVLINLEHRGAKGCDPETGDGAGILIQMTQELFRRQCSYEGISLPEAGA